MGPGCPSHTVLGRSARHVFGCGAAGALNGRTLQTSGGRIRELLTHAPALHAAEAANHKEDTECEASKKHFPSLHSWLEARLLPACQAASTAARTLCDDLPDALHEPGARRHLGELQGKLACLQQAWQAIDKPLPRQVLEVSVACVVYPIQLQ